MLPASFRQGSNSVDDVRGLVRAPATRLRREVRAIGLGEDPILRHGARGLPQLFRLRIGDVAGEGHVVPPLERRMQQSRRREAVQDDGAVEVPQRPCDVRVGGAAVDHDGLPELLRRREVRLEELPLSVVRRVVAVVVESRFADADGIELTEASQLGRVGVAGLVRVDAEDRVDALGRRAECGHLAPRGGPRPHLEDPVDARGPGPLDQLLRWLGARVQVRVRVDHAAAAGGASMRGKIGGAGSIPSASTVRPDATPDQSKSVGCPTASRICGAVCGRYAWRAIAATRRPSARAYSTRSSSAAFASSLASSQGFVSVTYLFRPRTNSQIASRAPVRSYASSLELASVARRWIAASSPSPGATGIFPPRYLAIIAVVLETRLPRSFPSSRS